MFYVCTPTQACDPKYTLTCILVVTAIGRQTAATLGLVVQSNGQTSLCFVQCHITLARFNAIIGPVAFKLWQDYPMGEAGARYYRGCWEQSGKESETLFPALIFEQSVTSSHPVKVKSCGPLLPINTACNINALLHVHVWQLPLRSVMSWEHSTYRQVRAIYGKQPRLKGWDKAMQVKQRQREREKDPVCFSSLKEELRYDGAIWWICESWLVFLNCAPLNPFLSFLDTFSASRHPPQSPLHPSLLMLTQRISHKPKSSVFFKLTGSQWEPLKARLHKGLWDPRHVRSSPPDNDTSSCHWMWQD